MPFQPSGRFGSALAVLDFNKDGMPDLAVGAPSVGSEQLTYKVRVLLGAGVGGWEGGAAEGAGVHRASGESRQPDVPGRDFGVGGLGLPIRVLNVTLVAWQHPFLPP